MSQVTKSIKYAHGAKTLGDAAPMSAYLASIDRKRDFFFLRMLHVKWIGTGREKQTVVCRHGGKRDF